ncbi:MAG: rhodanese-like domain-containing protein [Maribacter sp.]
MKSVVSLLILLLLNFSCAQSSSKLITEVSQNELNNVILVDVRTPEEFDAGHLENAKNINWFDTDFANQFKGISKDETIYVYCKKGGRSAKAQKALDSLGYKKVVNLEGGYDAYSKK